MWLYWKVGGGVTPHPLPAVPICLAHFPRPLRLSAAVTLDGGWCRRWHPSLL